MSYPHHRSYFRSLFSCRALRELFGYDVSSIDFVQSLDFFDFSMPLPAASSSTATGAPSIESPPTAAPDVPTIDSPAQPERADTAPPKVVPGGEGGDPTGGETPPDSSVVPPGVTAGIVVAVLAAAVVAVGAGFLTYRHFGTGNGPVAESHSSSGSESDVASVQNNAPVGGAGGAGTADPSV